MKRVILCLATAGVLALLGSSNPAAAKGCIRGAFMGGVAGHYVAHHGLLGAAAGCLVGRHEAKKRARMQTNGAAEYDTRYDRR